MANWLQRSLMNASQLATGGSSKVFGAPLTDIIKRSPNGIPVVLTKCIEYLDREEVMKQEGLFRKSGNYTQIQDMKQRFDRGEDVDLSKIQDPHTVCGVMKQYLRELPEPLCTYELYDCFIAAIGIPDETMRMQQLSKVLDMLPEPNQVLTKYLISFLCRVSTYSNDNLMTPSNLATVFAPNLIRPPGDDLGALVEYTPHSNRTMETLIIHFNELLGKFPDPEPINNDMPDIQQKSGWHVTKILPTGWKNSGTTTPGGGSTIIPGAPPPLPPHPSSTATSPPPLPPYSPSYSSTPPPLPPHNLSNPPPLPPYPSSHPSESSPYGGSSSGQYNTRGLAQSTPVFTSGSDIASRPRPPPQRPPPPQPSPGIGTGAPSPLGQASTNAFQTRNGSDPSNTYPPSSHPTSTQSGTEEEERGPHRRGARVMKRDDITKLQAQSTAGTSSVAAMVAKSMAATPSSSTSSSPSLSQSSTASTLIRPFVPPASASSRGPSPSAGAAQTRAHSNTVSGQTAPFASTTPPPLHRPAIPAQPAQPAYGAAKRPLNNSGSSSPTQGSAIGGQVGLSVQERMKAFEFQG